MQKWPCVKAEAPKTVLLPTYLMALIPFHGATDGSHRRECGVCEMARCRRGRQTIYYPSSKIFPSPGLYRGTRERAFPCHSYKRSCPRAKDSALLTKY